MRFPSKEIVEGVRRQYPVGCRVQLTHMDDVQAPPIGTKGTVVGVDDTASIMVAWDNGSGLNVVYGEDSCKKLDSVDGKIKEQILYIRVSGLTNMFDVTMVQRLANEYGFYELVIFLEENRADYVRFILYGEA